jgi:hypothetical protein
MCLIQRKIPSYGKGIVSRIGTREQPGTGLQSYGNNCSLLLDGYAFNLRELKIES